MKAASELIEKTQERERGTPLLKDNLPRRPIIIIALVCITSAVLATALFLYSSPHILATTVIDLVKLVCIACLGSISTSVGIIFGDSLSHVFSFGLALLFINYDNVKSSIAAASPCLILAACSAMKGPHEIISAPLLDSTFLLTPIFLQSLCTIPLLLLTYQSISNPAHLPFSTLPTCSVAFVTLLLMYMYNKNKAHKNGCLLTSGMKSQSIFAGIAMLLSCSIALESNPDSSTIPMTVYLLGSLITILMSFSFAAVADVWYTVGSGQFLMTSLDTAGMMIYFICPAIIIYLRFIDKYGDIIGFQFRKYAGRLDVLSTVVVSDGDVMSFTLVISLTMITVVGVPLLNAMCPMGGNLYSRAYTHGQPNTKKVALCVNFSDLPKEADQRIRIWNALEKKRMDDQTTAVLNIYVTLEDLMVYSMELKLIAEKGHAIALAPTEFEEESFCGLSIFHGNKSTCNLQIGHFEYTELFGKEPIWVLSKSADSIGRHPSFLRETCDLGMKIAYWSTLVQLKENGLTSEQKNALTSDTLDKNGGSIIYVIVEDGVSSNTITTSLCEVIDTLGYSLESLSDVAKDEAKMILS